MKSHFFCEYVLQKLHQKVAGNSMKMKRKSFKARHGKNIAKGKMSAAYWADKVKW